MTDSNYEKLLKEKYYPDPVIFAKEKIRIRESIKNLIHHCKREIELNNKKIESLNNIIAYEKNKLKELSAKD
jgi:hypothetical protein